MIGLILRSGGAHEATGQEAGRAVEERRGCGIGPMAGGRMSLFGARIGGHPAPSHLCAGASHRRRAVRPFGYGGVLACPGALLRALSCPGGGAGAPRTRPSGAFLTPRGGARSGTGAKVGGRPLCRDGEALLPSAARAGKAGARGRCGALPRALQLRAACGRTRALGGGPCGVRCLGGSGYRGAPALRHGAQPCARGKDGGLLDALHRADAPHGLSLLPPLVPRIRRRAQAVRL